MANQTITSAIKELKWIYWTFPGVFVAGLVSEIALNWLGDPAPVSDAALVIFWALFGYAVQTFVLRHAIRMLERRAANH